jgi:hypothetical protein
LGDRSVNRPPVIDSLGNASVTLNESNRE